MLLTADVDMPISVCAHSKKYSSSASETLQAKLRGLFFRPLYLKWARSSTNNSYLSKTFDKFLRSFALRWGGDLPKALV